MSYDKNQALQGFDSPAANQIGEKATVDEVAAQSERLEGSFDTSFGWMLEEGSEKELKRWMLLRSLYIAVGVVLLLLLLAYFKLIKIPR